MAVYSIHVMLNLSILLVACAAFYRYKLFYSTISLFLVLMVAGGINEILSYYLVLHGLHNSANSNIYVLAEFILLCLQFFKWGTLKDQIFYGILTGGILLWIADNLMLHRLSDNNSFFRMGYSLVIFLLSINTMNKLITAEKERHDSFCIFNISIACTLYFGFKTFAEVFNLFDIGIKQVFYYYLWFGLSVLNGFCNILYTIAILCYPRRQPFILHC